MAKLFFDSVHSKNLVEMWGDFIDWNRRRKGENGFLKKTLLENNSKKIFDAGLGDGCDSIYLLKEGFDVLSNELDFGFIRKAHENARKENVKLDVVSFNWLELDRHLQENSFDAVLCTGNSITYLFTEQEQLNALRQFRRLLNENGLLIVDERNYQYFLDKKNEILKGKFNYSGKYVYSGDNVHAYPVEITDKKVIMEYFDSINGNKAHLDLYPFKRNELFNLLKKAGFKNIKQFSDYKKWFNSKADFYTYVCRK